jgi:hypothetical protein
MTKIKKSRVMKQVTGDEYSIERKKIKEAQVRYLQSFARSPRIKTAVIVKKLMLRFHVIKRK